MDRVDRVSVLLRIHSRPFHGYLTISQDYLVLGATDGQRQELEIEWRAVVGCSGNGKEVKMCFYDLTVQAFKWVEGLTDTNQTCEEVCTHIQSKINIDKTRYLAIILNPISGRKRSKVTWDRLFQPLLSISGLRYDLYETTGPDSVSQICSSSPISRYSDVVCMGGDGLVHQVINEGKDRKWRVGVLPMGSQNALACAVGCRSVSTACYHILAGNTVPGGVLLATLDANRSVLSCCGVAWGVVSTLSKQAQHMREFGAAVGCMQRYVMSALGMFISHWRQYTAKVEVKRQQDSEWETLEGPFMLVTGTKHACPSSLSSELLYPGADVRDSQVYLVVLSAGSRFDMLRFLSQLRVPST